MSKIVTEIFDNFWLIPSLHDQVSTFQLDQPHVDHSQWLRVRVARGYRVGHCSSRMRCCALEGHFAMEGMRPAVGS